jgi:hypothetical protein
VKGQGVQHEGRKPIGGLSIEEAGTRFRKAASPHGQRKKCFK